MFAWLPCTNTKPLTARNAVMSQPARAGAETRVVKDGSVRYIRVLGPDAHRCVAAARGGPDCTSRYLLPENRTWPPVGSGSSCAKSLKGVSDAQSCKRRS